MTYYSILTNKGLEKITKALAGEGENIRLAKMFFGDGGGTQYEPSASQTELKNKVAERPLKSLNIEPENIHQIFAEAVIPTDIGGFWVREAALYDIDGDMIAVSSIPDTYKPALSEGAGKDLVIRIDITVQNSSVINLIINPNITTVTFNDLEHGVSEQGYNYTVTRYKDGSRVLEMWGNTRLRDIADIKLPVQIIPAQSSCSHSFKGNNELTPLIKTDIENNNITMHIFNNTFFMGNGGFYQMWTQGSPMAEWKIYTKSMLQGFKITDAFSFKGYMFMPMIDLINGDSDEPFYATKLYKTDDFITIDKVDFPGSKIIQTVTNQERILMLVKKSKEVYELYETEDAVEWTLLKHDTLNPYHVSAIVANDSGFFISVYEKQLGGILYFFNSRASGQIEPVTINTEGLTASGIGAAGNKYFVFCENGPILFSEDFQTWGKNSNMEQTVEQVAFYGNDFAPEGCYVFISSYRVMDITYDMSGGTIQSLGENVTPHPYDGSAILFGAGGIYVSLGDFQKVTSRVAPFFSICEFKYMAPISFHIRGVLA